MIASPGEAGIVIHLCESVRNRLAEVLRELLLPIDAAGIELRPPNVFGAFLPPKRGHGRDKADDAAPFVLVRPTSGWVDNDPRYSRVQLRLIIMTYAEDPAGYETALMVLERIRLNFFMYPLIDDRYMFESIFKWELIEDQPYPQWQAFVDTEWTVPTPQIVTEEGDT